MPDQGSNAQNRYALLCVCISEHYWSTTILKPHHSVSLVRRALSRHRRWRMTTPTLTLDCDYIICVTLTTCCPLRGTTFGADTHETRTNLPKPAHLCFTTTSPGFMLTTFLLGRSHPTRFERSASPSCSTTETLVRSSDQNPTRILHALRHSDENKMLKRSFTPPRSSILHQISSK